MSMLTGGTSCCIILTSLEVLKACKKECHEEDMVYSLHFALLYQYAQQKVGLHDVILDPRLNITVFLNNAMYM